MATVSSIIRKHGGHIDVETTIGKGTTFTLYLPASVSLTEPATKAPDNHATSSFSSLNKTPTLRALVMDDEQMILDLLTHMLTSNGFTVEVAMHGKRAIELYKESFDRQQTFDIVIMDLTIPGGLGGKDAIKEILKIDSKAQVIVSSGYSDDPVIANYAEYGFKGVAVKPYKMGKLLDVLGQVIQLPTV